MVRDYTKNRHDSAPKSWFEGNIIEFREKIVELSTLKLIQNHFQGSITDQIDDNEFLERGLQLENKRNDEEFANF